jgi:hypothetical protein
MDATDRFKRLVIVILVCFRHRSHDRFLQRKKAEASAIEVERRLKNSAFWVLCAPPCSLAVPPFRAAETAKCSAKPCPPALTSPAEAGHTTRL